jgi:hypothetical protein
VEIALQHQQYKNEKEKKKRETEKREEGSPFLGGVHRSKGASRSIKHSHWFQPSHSGSVFHTEIGGLNFSFILL